MPTSKLRNPNDTKFSNGIQDALAKDSATNPSANGLVVTSSDQAAARTIFPPLPPAYTRNLLIVDTHFISPGTSDVGIPGPDSDEYDVGTHSLADVGEDVIAELPVECRQAFENAEERERSWKHQWQAETQDGARGKLRIGF